MRRLIHRWGAQAFAGQGSFRYVTGMDGERISRALARIEAAASRIEAATRASARPQPDGTYLAAKYQTLRTETGAALAELDRLIGSLEQ